MVWHAGVLVVLILAAAISVDPSLSPSPSKMQVALLAVIYLGISLFIVPLSAGPRWALFGGTALFAIGGLGAGYALLRHAYLPVSLSIIAIGGFVSAVAALVPYLSRRAKFVAASVASVGCVAMIVAGKVQAGAAFREETINTALHAVNAKYYLKLIKPPASDGGGLDSVNAGTMLGTGDGTFFWLIGAPGGLSATLLNIPDPMQRNQYLQGFARPDRAPRLRLTDIIFERSALPKRLFAAHQIWNRSKRCYMMGVSAIALTWSPSGLPQAQGRWRSLFQSKPCIRAAGTFDDSETGGRLAWSPEGALLLTLGDVGFSGADGNEPLSQSPDSDYGKILALDVSKGGHSLVSIGHRNPQGMVVTQAGAIWETEHGPQGGDEINFISKGRNYGWPYATYGTDYGSYAWRLNPDARNHGRYQEPAIAFLPAIAISSIIELQGEQFSRWKGDLLASSLRTKALFRVRYRDDRIIYVESISVGHRVRDLTQMADGRILVWSDDGTVIELNPAMEDDVFSRMCAGCHEPKFGAAAGPPLRRVIGRPIATVPGFDYSAGLKKRTGVWDEGSLDAFLRDPDGFAPGTTMKLSGLDDFSRARVIQQLKEKR